MLYTPRGSDPRDPDGLLYQSLEPVVRGLGLSLIELSVFRGGRGGNTRKVSRNVQVKATVYKAGITGVEDCSRVHRGILPRLELAFPGQDIYLEVSSPGINRIIKDGSEFVHFIGQGVRCYRTDISDWTAGILCAADEKGIVIRVESVSPAASAAASAGGEVSLPYEVIAKARLAGDVDVREKK